MTHERRRLKKEHHEEHEGKSYERRFFFVSFVSFVSFVVNLFFFRPIGRHVSGEKGIPDDPFFFFSVREPGYK